MVLLLGKNFFLPENPDAYSDLPGNTWLVGQTGKSTLLENLATQLAYQGVAFAFIDPLSTSVPFLLEHLPKRWHRDTVYADPFDPEYVLPWNPLEDLQLQQEKITAQMVALFRKMLKEGAFEGRSQDVLRMSLLALSGLEDATFLHIEKLLHDDSWRRNVIVPKLLGSVRRFWEQEYEQWIKDRQKTMAIAAPQNKLRIFTTSQILTEMLCAKERIAPREIMQNKILLCDIQGHELGEIEAGVLSSLFLARLTSTANHEYVVLIDNAEFISKGVLDAALANPYLKIIVATDHSSQIDMKRIQNFFVFQVNEDDANKFKGIFPYHMQRYFMDVGEHICYVKCGRELLYLKTYPPYAGTLSKTADRIRTQSAQRYARTRSAVRAYLASVV